MKLIQNSSTPKAKATVPKKEGIRRMLSLVAITVTLATLYYLLPAFGFFYAPHVYLAVGGGLALGYVIYNRGFYLRGITADMLPDHIPAEKRQQMIEDGARRFEKSRWMLLILLPILLVFMIDIIYLFMIPEGLFS